MDLSRLTYLFEQYESDKASEAELDELFSIMTDESNKDELPGYLADSMRDTVPDRNPDIEKWRPVIARIVTTKPGSMQVSPAARRISFWWRYAAAAMITLLIGTGVYYLVLNKTEKPAVVKNDGPKANDITAPDRVNAVITLANGEKIVLDSAANGALANQGNTQLVKLANGKIAYKGAASEVLFNTLTNPRGSKVVNLELADGTMVWLNAGSSITYPVSFVGNERKVEITGEAYFEVTGRFSSTGGGREGAVKMPFIVKKGDVEVLVLGTHFNVNAYDDEPEIQVTLLEGSVRVSNNAHAVIIKPGQQAAITRNSTPETRNSIDLDAVMAWKNGSFYFRQADVPAIMRQVARWYNVDVVYEGAVPQGYFNGKPSRNLSAAEMLKILEYTGIKIKIEGNKIIVSQ